MRSRVETGLSGALEVNRKTLLILVIGMFVAVPSFFLFCEWRRGRARSYVRETLRRMGPEAVVIADGTTPARNRELLDDLAGISWVFGHKSHAGRRFRVLVRSGEEELELELGRDSQIPTEYWVYFPDWSWFADYNEIGRIRTSLLDDIESSGNSRPRRERGR
jgi:hypothetical protein